MRYTLKNGIEMDVVLRTDLNGCPITIFFPKTDDFFLIEVEDARTKSTNHCATGSSAAAAEH